MMQYYTLAILAVVQFLSLALVFLVVCPDLRSFRGQDIFSDNEPW